MVYKYISKMNETSDRTMFILYAVDLLTEIIYIYALRDPNYWAHSRPAFMLFYLAVSGALLVIDAFLIWCVITKRSLFMSMALLVIFAAIQGAAILVGVPANIAFSDFWGSGYLYFVLKAATAAIYTGRFFMLKAERDFLHGCTDTECQMGAHHYGA